MRDGVGQVADGVVGDGVGDVADGVVERRVGEAADGVLGDGAGEVADGFVEDDVCVLAPTASLEMVSVSWRRFGGESVTFWRRFGILLARLWGILAQRARQCNGHGLHWRAFER